MGVESFYKVLNWMAELSDGVLVGEYASFDEAVKAGMAAAEEGKKRGFGGVDVLKAIEVRSYHYESKSLYEMLEMKEG